MSCVTRLFPMLLLFSVTAAAQFPPAPTPTPRPGSRQANQPAAAADTDNFNRIRAMELMLPKDKAAEHPLLDPKKGIYRRPAKSEVAVLAVDESLIARYAEFLKGPNTGIVKLNGESSCISDDDVVVATEKCALFAMPGSGASYSFRTESYRLPRLADVILFDGIFKTGGVLQHVVMADVGDIPIAETGLDSKAMKYLVELRPVGDSDQFMAFEAESAKGIQSDGFLYRKGHLVKKNSTYFLRSIAYRGTYVRAVEGIQYDEMDFDKRRDVIVAFRVVDQDEIGNVTIVWKMLKDTEAPKLKIKR